MSEFRVDAAGIAWQPCPRCGLDRVPSANGIRLHDEHCNGALQPFMTILADRGLRPFHREPWVNPYTERVDNRVLGEQPAMRWRVGTGQWERLHAWARQHVTVEAADLPETLFGWPIDVDRSLSSMEIVFELVTP